MSFGKKRKLLFLLSLSLFLSFRRFDLAGFKPKWRSVNSFKKHQVQVYLAPYEPRGLKVMGE